MLSLKSRGIIKSMEFNSFTRIHHEDTEIKVNNASIHCVQQTIFNDIHILGGQTNANNRIEQTTDHCSHHRTILRKISRWRDAGEQRDICSLYNCW